MTTQRLSILLLTLACSCHPTNKKEKGLTEGPTHQTEVETNPIDRKAVFDHSSFLIQKGQLGEIAIGMTIHEAEQKFSGLSKTVGLATGFGFGGGGPAYSYYKNDQMAFALIPALNTDTLVFIVAVDPSLATSNRLNPESSAEDIVRLYPGIKVNQDIMNGWEFISDTTNNWDFVFMTEGDEKVGNYPELELPSTPVNVEIKSAWIIIK